MRGSECTDCDGLAIIGVGSRSDHNEVSAILAAGPHVGGRTA